MDALDGDLPTQSNEREKASKETLLALFTNDAPS